MLERYQPKRARSIDLDDLDNLSSDGLNSDASVSNSSDSSSSSSDDLDLELDDLDNLACSKPSKPTIDGDSDGGGIQNAATAIDF